jgi:hypothetical protein
MSSAISFPAISSVMPSTWSGQRVRCGVTVMAVMCHRLVGEGMRGMADIMVVGGMTVRVDDYSLAC